MSLFKRSEFKVELLPVGVEEFYAWADKVIALTDLPNNDSIKFALATIILELKPEQGLISKHDVAVRLTKAAANQVASYVFQDLKSRRQEADRLAAESAKKLEEEASQKPADEQVVDNHEQGSVSEAQS